METTNHTPETYEVAITRREMLLTRIMKLLAVVGTVTLLALIAYVAVSAFQTLPKVASRVGSGLQAGVVSITSVFTPSNATGTEDSLVDTNESELVIVPSDHTTSTTTDAQTVSCQMGTHPTKLVRGNAATLSWTSTNATGGVVDHGIGTVETLGFRSITPTETTTYIGNFTGIDGKLATCQTTVTVTAATATTQTTNRTSTSGTTASAPRTTTPASVPTPVVTRVPADRGPSDLAIEIIGTGVLKKVSGESTFIKLSEIPSDETAAVRFVVTNLGSKTSDTYTFKVTVPTRGGDDYTYTSKTQKALDGGAKVEYTLGFDDLPKSGSYTVEVSIDTDDDAKSGNNDDSESVMFIKP